MVNMRIFLYAIGVTALIFTMLPGIADANKYQNKANKWCANYSHSNQGKQCRVVHRGKLCPKGFRRAHKFGRIGRGFKACTTGTIRHTQRPIIRHRPRPAPRPGGGGGLAVAPISNQLARMPFEGSKISIWFRTPDGGDTKPLFPASLKFKKRKAGLERIEALSKKNHGGPHIQGVQRLSIGRHPYIAYTAKSVESGVTRAHLFIARLASKAGFGDTPLDTNFSKGRFSASKADRNLSNVLLNRGVIGGQDLTSFNHPGGFQAVGSLVFVGMNGSAKRGAVMVYRISPQGRAGRIGGFLVNHKAETLGAIHLGAGKYLLAIGEIDGKVREIYFYQVVLTGNRLTATPSGVPWRETNKPFQSAKYQSTNLIRQANGEIFLAGIANETDYKCAKGDIRRNIAGRGGRTIFDLYKYQRPNRLTRISRRTFANYSGAACAGGGVFVNRAGEMSIYLMEHWGRRHRKGKVRVQFDGWGVVPLYEIAAPRARRTGVTVFADKNFSGKRYRFVSNVQNLSAVPWKLNDKISSIRIHSGVWEMCQDKNYRGRCESFSRSNGDLKSMNFGDKISSIRRLR